MLEQSIKKKTKGSRTIQDTRRDYEKSRPWDPTTTQEIIINNKTITLVWVGYGVREYLLCVYVFINISNID
jgi:hypothetical protein